MKIYLAYEQQQYEGIVKILGCFSTLELAKQAIHNYIGKRPFFRIKVEDCEIEEFDLDVEKE
jgi:restriction endonuclease